MTELTISQRFTEFLAAKKISQELFADVTGMTSATVSNIAKGVTKEPKAAFFQLVAYHYPELNLRWLLIGEGEMENEQGAFPVVAKEPPQRAGYRPAAAPGAKSIEQLSGSVEALTTMLSNCMAENERLRKGGAE